MKIPNETKELKMQFKCQENRFLKISIFSFSNTFKGYYLSNCMLYIYMCSSTKIKVTKASTKKCKLYELLICGNRYHI